MQNGSCVESMTLCASPQSEVRVEELSKELVVRGGNQNSNSQRNEGSTTSQIQPKTPRGGAT